MPMQFHVLASGSSGNACVLDTGDFGVLLDFGLSPRQLAPRMKQCGISWERIHSVVMTHAHTDHWQAATLAHLAKLRLPVYCHEEHAKEFDHESRAFAALSSAGLIRPHEPGVPLKLHDGVTCLPIGVQHDAAMTCGFRFEGKDWSVGYAADLGCWTPELAQQFTNADLLALEFNHDVAMQMASGRHPLLIRRVLGDQGHLSNDQGAALFAEILNRSEAGRVQHLVQLHLSRQCNHPDLAHEAAQQVADRLGIEIAIHTTNQGQAGPSITLGDRAKPSKRQACPPAAFVQSLLPFDESRGARGRA